MPQHSFGASSRACATISSSCSRVSRTAGSGLELAAALAGDRVALVVVVLVLGVHVHGFLELTDALADRARDLGQPLGTQDDQCDREDDDDLCGSDLAEHGL